LGLKAQLERLEEEAKRRGWKAEVVTERGVSGKVPAEERPALGPALDSLQLGDVLVVAKLDRLSRSVLDFASLLERAESEGWSLVVLDLGVDTTTPNGRLVVHVLVAIAEWERKMIGVRTREGMAKSDKPLGRKPGLPPVGGGKPATIPESTLAAIQRMLKDGHSPRIIAEELNAQGHKSPRGKRWHRESVRRLLTRLDKEESKA
jgi:DNA invertase Pin-like site-specific DNA recombinase